MLYSTIDPRIGIMEGRVKCFETEQEALDHARETGATAYLMGYPIQIQKELNFENKTKNKNR